MNGRPHDAELEAALDAGRERRYADAVAILSKLLRSSDAYPEAVLYLGRAYHALGEFARAVAVLTFFTRLAPRSAAGHFFLGRSYLAFGRAQLALRHLKRSVALRPGFVPSLSLAGVACLRCRRPEEAVAFLERAVEGAPDNKPVFTAYLNALLTQAIRLFRAGDLTMSGQILQFILRHHEESVTAHLYLGRILRDLGKPLPALPHFEAAALLAPEDPTLHLQIATVLLQAGDTDRAQEELRKAATAIDAKAFLTRDPTELARILAVSHFQSGQYRDAVGYGLQVLKQHPGEPHIHVIVAEALRNLGQLEKARNHYERAMDSPSAGPDVMYGLAMVLLEQGKLEELRGVLSRIDRARPGDATASYYLAICRSRLGEDPTVTVKLLQEQVRARGADPFLMLALAKDYLRAGLPELAAGWFRKTLKVREADREALLGLVEATTALGDTEARLDSLRQCLKAYPNEHSLRKDFVRLLLERGDHAEAEQHIERLIPVEPANRTLRQLLATCYRHTGRYGDAIVLLKELIIADPRSEDTLKALVYCMDRAGDRALAARVLEKAAPAFPESIELRLILGVLFMRSNELERAAKVFRDVVSMSPAEPAAYENLGHIHKKQGDEAFAQRFYARAAAARKKRAAAAGPASRVRKPAAPKAAAPKAATLRTERRRR
jgi:tetratricopeptide (TPR) repeat protein